ncbi:MAG: winged helix-turn-helix transcriptional regulator [Chloroflexi bacterium]|nr:winged helix-turn-helix transcriptional regulator [Chloroflexota bacterium]
MTIEAHPAPADAPPLTVSRPELLVDGSDAAFRTLVHQIFALAARHQAVRDGHAARIGLAGAQYTVLIAVAHLRRYGPVSIRQVADYLYVTPAFITMEVRKLVRDGLLAKRRNAADARSVLLTVTPAGRARLEQLAPVQRTVNDQQFADLSSTDMVELQRLLQLLIDNSDRAIALQEYLRAGAPTATH